MHISKNDSHLFESMESRSQAQLTRSRLRTAARLAVAACALFALPLRAQVPAVVASSNVNLTPANGVNMGPAVADACGNVYVNQSGQIVEFAHDTGVQTIIAANNQGYGGPNSIAIDPTRTYLYFPLGTSANNQWYSSSWSVTTITNCVPGGPTTFPATGVSYLESYYFGTAAVLGTDGYGDVFFTSTSNPKEIAEIACSQTGGVACPTYPSGTNAALITGTLTNAPTSMAGDQKGNLFYTDGTSNVYEIVAPNVTAGAKTPYTPVVVASHFVDAVAVVTDSSGNLYITDSNGYNSNIYYSTNFSAIVYEIPNENGVLNFAHQFIVSNSTGIAAQPAVDAAGDLFYTSYPPSNEQNLWETVRGGVKLQPALDGVTTSATVNYVFNAPATVGSFNYTASAGSTLTANGGTCTAGKAYTAGQSCTAGVNYTATAPGLQPAAINLLDGSGNLLLAGAVYGTGLGSAITVDPGTQSTVATTFKQPTAVAVDFNNNRFVVDTYSNTVTEFASGSTTGTTVSTGTLLLTGPSGVAVDGFGNLYIADTGNNRIVEVPFLKGALAPASATALSITVGGTALKSPAGLAIGTQNGLFIADTGNNRVVGIPNRGGVLATASGSSYGTGLKAPLAVAVDLNGNLFVADSGNGAILKVNAPLASGQQLDLVTGLGNPTSVSTDASGSLFVVDQANAAVLKYPLVSGLFGTPNYVGGTIPTPYGVAVDSRGNLVVTDSTHGTLSSLNRTGATLAFGNWNVNATSTQQTAVISNSGDANLTFNTPDTIASGATTEFAIASDSCSTAGAVVPGNFCTIMATFKPTKTETNATDTLSFSTNASQATLSLVGTGEVIATTSTTVSLTTTGALSAGVSATFNAVVGIGSGTAAPTGYITFYVNGSQYGPDVQVTKTAGGYSASLTFPNGLPAGSVQVAAVYSGDSNYSGSQGFINETVVGLNAGLTLIITTPYVNPQSTNDSPANTAGPKVPLTASLVVTSKIIPTGTVKFYTGSTSSPSLVGVAALTPVTGGYQANLTESVLRALTGTAGENGSIVANYNLFAVYSGDNFYLPETSNAVPLVIAGAPSTQAACVTAGSCSPNTTGATFTISPANPSLTISSTTLPGTGTGSVLLSVTSLGGWTGLLNFTCSNLPKYAVCAPYPGAPVINASTPNSNYGPGQVQFIINTNVVPVVANGGFTWWISGAAGLALLLMRRRLAKRGLASFGTGLAMLLLLAGSVGAASGCSSGINPAITPAGTTNVKVVVSAAQLNPSSSVATGTVFPKDSNPITFNIALTVQ